MKNENVIQKDGFAYKFNADACKNCEGNCCIGESGYIWVTPKEIEEIAKFLKMDTEFFRKNCLIKAGYKFSIREKPYKNGFACMFFDKNKGCMIYPVRPKQCRTYPFWDYFKTHLDELKKECPGIIMKEVQ